MGALSAIYSAWGVQERALELLRARIPDHVGAGTRTQSSRRAASTFLATDPPLQSQ